MSDLDDLLRSISSDCEDDDVRLFYKDAIKDMWLEIVGEDESPNYQMNGAIEIAPNWKEVTARNDLRAELRKKIEVL